MIFWYAVVIGSSPRPRGAHSGRDVPLPARGIIPASAGSTPNPRRPSGPGGDHPRVRGERSQTMSRQSSCCGSSPRPRGAHAAAWPAAVHRGIIPASAGSARSRRRHSQCRPDHPRVRGERGIVFRESLTISGSSPRPRGAHDPLGLHCDCRRIIPASAGSARLMVGPSVRVEDHPRVRGERVDRGVRSGVRAGSSPRPRGAQGCCLHRREPRRIIPASAGSASW